MVIVWNPAGPWEGNGIWLLSCSRVLQAPRVFHGRCSAYREITLGSEREICVKRAILGFSTPGDKQNCADGCIVSHGVQKRRAWIFRVHPEKGESRKWSQSGNEHLDKWEIKEKTNKQKGSSLSYVSRSLQHLSKSWSTHSKDILFYFLLCLLSTFKLFWYYSLAWAERRLF